jgi:hypothetical protein
MKTHLHERVCGISWEVGIVKDEHLFVGIFDDTKLAAKRENARGVPAWKSSNRGR